MKTPRYQAGFTVIELVCAIAIIAVLSSIYFFLVNSYGERRMSEQAAKVLMLAARAEEEFFAKEHRYFDAEVPGNGTDMHLATPEGQKTPVLVPPKVFLSVRSRGKDKAAFTGQAFYSGSKLLHRYDSETGKITTIPRTQDDSG